MKKFLIGLIHFYQKYISPYKGFKCPYYPTCSRYAIQAVDKFGAVRGSILALWRILRCNPFSHGGYDFVPEYTDHGFLKDPALKKNKSFPKII